MIRSIMPYAELSIVKIYQAVDSNYYIDFCMNDKTVLKYKVKPECLDMKAFGGGRIRNHWDTDFTYNMAGAETEQEKQEIIDLLSWSDYDCFLSWANLNGSEYININEYFAPMV
jgi:hypothetical protein